MSGSEVFVTCRDQSRQADFMRVFGSVTVPVLSPEIRLVELPGRGPTWVYMLDLDRLHAGHRLAMVDHIVDRFGEPRDRVLRDLERKGMPIIAEGCELSVDGQPAEPRRVELSTAIDWRLLA